MSIALTITSLIILAVIVEALWETVKLCIPVHIPDWGDRCGAIAIALILTIGTGLDLMVLLNIPVHIPYIGLILTAILISRGSNFMHDLLVKVQGVKQLTDILNKVEETDTSQNKGAVETTITKTEKETANTSNNPPPTEQVFKQGE